MHKYNLHTEVLLLGLWLFHHTEEQLREMADDDEGGCQCWTAVVFHNQVVPLELPEDICVALHHLECVAGENTTHTAHIITLCFIF